MVSCGLAGVSSSAAKSLSGVGLSSRLLRARRRPDGEPRVNLDEIGTRLRGGDDGNGEPGEAAMGVRGRWRFPGARGVGGDVVVVACRVILGGARTFGACSVGAGVCLQSTVRVVVVRGEEACFIRFAARFDGVLVEDVVAGAV
ncbi:hypothetical protein PPROV_000896000 [Pycnococcus provasolii]|uniref:Uncharacterized protein n=1 Tax=Pycnococcus provasolii TaxID=41880 RepID=A0A830HTC0_9CHLO|nr:hypothetical protein PPROV_000896000 [Pycnococcus provasolii]